MNDSQTGGLYARRWKCYEEQLTQSAHDAFVLTSEPALAHSCGIRLYSQRLVPERPVVVVILAGGCPALVCVEYEVERVTRRGPELEIHPYREFSDDPWAIVARMLRVGGAERVVVESTFATSWHEQLRVHWSGNLTISSDLASASRIIKDTGEIELLTQASTCAEHAIAAGAKVARPGRTERQVASTIANSFTQTMNGQVGEVIGLCSAQDNEREMHHLASNTPIDRNGPIRLGIVGRVDGYWILITRMILVGADSRFEHAYERYRLAYDQNLLRLRSRTPGAKIYRECRRHLADRGLSLTAEKVAHGTGLDFRERPWVAEAEDDIVHDRMVMAFDYAVDIDGYVLHLEDRVLVTAGHPRRLSDRWDLADLRTGHEALL